MTTLTEFWPTVPTLTDEQLKAYAVVLPTDAAKDYLFGQDGLLSVSLCRCEPRQIRDGSYVFCADLLREFHVETATGLYGNKIERDEEGNPLNGTGYDDILAPIADTILIEDWATSIAELPPSPPSDDTPVEWQSGYQVPGASHPGYPRGARVTYSSITYTSLCNWNTWTPDTENGLTWAPPRRQNGDQWVQPTGAQDAYAIGEEVFHDPGNGRPERNWRSKIAANTTIPGTDGSPGNWFDRWWEPIGDFLPTPEPEPKAWVQPVPGTTARPYMAGEKAIYNGQTVRSTVNDNVWSPKPYPDGYGWEVVG